nr:MAG TPA: hypothetical protein [Caudoviricetes sp.]
MSYFLPVNASLALAFVFFIHTITLSSPHPCYN